MPGATSEIGEDGRHHLTLSQSWIGTATTVCPEQARRELVGELPEVDTDAAAIGTAVHYAIERALYWASVNHMHDHFEAKWDELVQLDTFKWVKYDYEQAYNLGTRFVNNWIEWADLDDLFSWETYEHEFLVPFYEDDERVIQLEGTMDLLEDDRVTDWKTTSRAWWPAKIREAERQAVQPTAYTAAATVLLEETVNRFRYVVMSPEGVQDFEVTRNESDWEWLKERAVQWARLIEADLPSWPVRDDTPLCSQTWAPCWDSCKGLYTP